MRTKDRSREEIAAVLGEVTTEAGTNLLALAEASPVLLVFLRHFGCSFCRQTISQIAELYGEMQQRGVRSVFVHLGTPEVAKAHFDYYGLGNVERVHDPQARLYQNPVFGLGKERVASQVFKPAVIAGWLKGAMSMETMLADMRLAMVPASMARRPRRARSLRRLGTRAPMPPICMPMEPTLAKPQRAKVAMEKVRGESVPFSLPSWVEGEELVDHGAGAEQVADGAALVPGDADEPGDGRADDAEDVR
jgi:hypothetical protein